MMTKIIITKQIATQAHKSEGKTNKQRFILTVEQLKIEIKQSNKCQEVIKHKPMIDRYF
jgi:hypothetical protein